jgi:hypothetical protein
MADNNAKTDNTSNNSFITETPKELVISNIRETLNPDKPKPEYYDDKEGSDNILDFEFPHYGVDEIINDVANWQRQLTNIGGEPGYFYFKIFFKFKTNYGLLADLLTELGTKQLSQGSAIFYLASIEHRYKHEQIPHRMLALYKFGSTLRALQTETPWFFKGVNGLDKLNSQFLTNIGKQQMLEIVCNTESVDMRLGTLLDLYKYACYDYANCKEIIPVNLRKFDMSIITYHMPLKLYNTHIIQSNQRKKKDKENVESKTMYPTTKGDINFSNVMSYKMYSFKNCEFDTETLDSYTPSSLSNETAFNMGGNTLKIKYDRVYEHRMNEWGQFMMGDTGFYYNEYAPASAIGTGNLTNVKDNSTPYVINTNRENQQSKRLEFIKKRYEGNGNGGFFAPKQAILDFGEWAIRDLDTKATSRITDLEIHTGRSGIGFLRHNTATLNRRLKEYKSSPNNILNINNVEVNTNIFKKESKSRSAFVGIEPAINEIFDTDKTLYSSTVGVNTNLFKKELTSGFVGIEPTINEIFKTDTTLYSSTVGVNNNIFDTPIDIQGDAAVNNNIFDTPIDIQGDAEVNDNIFGRYPTSSFVGIEVNDNIFGETTDIQGDAEVNDNIFGESTDIQRDAEVNTNIFNETKSSDAEAYDKIREKLFISIIQNRYT